MRKEKTSGDKLKSESPCRMTLRAWQTDLLSGSCGVIRDLNTKSELLATVGFPFQSGNVNSASHEVTLP